MAALKPYGAGVISPAVAPDGGWQGRGVCQSHGLAMLALAVEFARDTPEVEDLLGRLDAGGGMREQISRNLYGDYVFIAVR